MDKTFNIMNLRNNIPNFTIIERDTDLDFAKSFSTVYLKLIITQFDVNVFLFISVTFAPLFVSEVHFQTVKKVKFTLNLRDVCVGTSLVLFAL